MINSLKFLPKDFTTLRILLQIFCIKSAFPRYKLQSCIKIFKSFNFAFYDINFWFKISKICPKILHFSQISHSRGNTAHEKIASRAKKRQKAACDLHIAHLQCRGTGRPYNIITLPCKLLASANYTNKLE